MFEVAKHHAFYSRSVVWGWLHLPRDEEAMTISSSVLLVRAVALLFGWVRITSRISPQSGRRILGESFSKPLPRQLMICVMSTVFIA